VEIILAVILGMAYVFAVMVSYRLLSPSHRGADSDSMNDILDMIEDIPNRSIRTIIRFVAAFVVAIPIGLSLPIMFTYSAYQGLRAVRHFRFREYA
jgi:hypothetical protein